MRKREGERDKKEEKEGWEKGEGGTAIEEKSEEERGKWMDKWLEM